MKQKTYVTFGGAHKHTVNGFELNYKTVAVIYANSPKEGREKAFEYFGDAFAFEYPEKYFKFENIKKYDLKLVLINGDE